MNGPGAFVLAYECANEYGLFSYYDWNSGNPIQAFQGIVRIYFSSGPGYDFKTWIAGGERHWQAVGRARKPA